MSPLATPGVPAPTRNPRARALVPVAASLVLLLELAATLASVGGDAFAPVAGWGATRPADTLTFVLVGIGCAALYWSRTRPLTVLFAATGAYAAFLLLGHEPGLFLAPMFALFTAALQGAPRGAVLFAGAAAYAASLYWVYERAATIADPGAALLAWVAFGTVTGVFLAGPYVAGELVRLRRALTGRTTDPTPRPTTTP
ncbi:hypothetical protein [Nocardiopsis sp. NPDC006938]|uniref:hypothetical protein n=1 Tax=Nocardiopsis sp. NPDC006938 TaxID=3364337 RepID=UPI0036A76FAD